VTGDVFVILTAQEVTDEANFRFRDYWTSVVLCAKERSGLFRQHMKIYQMRVLEIARNNMADAHSVHQALKRIVKNEDVRRLKEFAPDPVPPEGLSAGGLQALAEKGITGEKYLVEAEVRARWGFKNEVEEVKGYRIEAERGVAWSQYSLGVGYDNGKGVAKDEVEAVKWYRKAAEQGLAAAQNNLGWCYYQGKGVPQDYTEAVRWFRKAAEQGLANAQCTLGYCHNNGEGVAKDPVEAGRWYRKAAEQGNAGGQNNLGSCYYQGEGVPQDYTEAVRWFRKAAEQGQANAQDGLGYCYHNGEGVLKDYVEAYKWCSLAAAQAVPNAKKHLSEIEHIMTPGQIAEGQRLAREFKPR
jgi:TPR repeat protein